MIDIIHNIVSLFIFSFLIAPIIMLSILLVRTNKPKNPTQSIKLEQLEQNDYNIVDDVNKAFHDVNSALNEINANLNEFGKRLEDIEITLEREENTVKGFNTRK